MSTGKHYQRGKGSSLIPRGVPMPADRTDVLTASQLEFVARQHPEPHRPIGCPGYTDLELLPGILKAFQSGCRWRDLDWPGYPSGITHWRRLQYWKRKDHFKRLWNRMLDVLLG
jgi:transposase